MRAASNLHETTLREHFSRARAARDGAARDPQSAADRFAIRRWQQERLATTHADLLAADETAPAAHFFLVELYTTDDLAQRDADIERVIRILVKFLPDRALSTLAAALEMDALAERLDARLASALRARMPGGAARTIDAERYAQAYRAMGEHDERLRQIALTSEIGTALDRLARMPLLRRLLRLMRGPAHAAGVGALHDFLERGYAAFAHMRDGKAFVRLITERERREHERLIGGGDG